VQHAYLDAAQQGAKWTTGGSKRSVENSIKSTIHMSFNSYRFDYHITAVSMQISTLIFILYPNFVVQCKQRCFLAQYQLYVHLFENGTGHSGANFLHVLLQLHDVNVIYYIYAACLFFLIPLS